ncbi:MAG: protein-L-isoaspartate(D-aspartate) O-methyltransferase [Gammaproteobacteria bacterium]|nr:MAG: protein-L-isoaspartate(D-aspartate) O-methyltransferase [Gammaproteobacteria bacterium]
MTSARTRERLVQRLLDNGISNLQILDRIRSVPRHLFVDEALQSRAYEDSALPIGYGQTISQPYIVALMTQALLDGVNPSQPLQKVLEVGTGCGYQTAILSPLVRQIFTIERIRDLMIDTRTRLAELGFQNIRFRHGDGMKGWPGQAPFDGILVAAAPAGIPQKLLDQLAVGGRLIIPVGPAGRQDLIRVTRTEAGLEQESLCTVSFVPLLEGIG